MSDVTFCTGVAELAAEFDHFVIDQWGVLHDGSAPYPGAIACLQQLRAAGKQILLLSNSGKRAWVNRERLHDIGYDESLFDHVVTSGEATWRALSDRTDPFFRDLGRRCVLWSRYGDRSLVEALDLEMVGVEQADFVLMAGTEDTANIEDYAQPLQAAVARGLPMVCANPDVIAVHAEGQFGFAPGAVARDYEQLGGQVFYVGKPHRPIYDLSLEALGHPAPGDVVAIGDSVQHDIAGGQGMGMHTVLNMSGIHSPHFDHAGGIEPNHPTLDRLEDEFGHRPHRILPSFRWEP